MWAGVRPCVTWPRIMRERLRAGVWKGARRARGREGVRACLHSPTKACLAAFGRFLHVHKPTQARKEVRARKAFTFAQSETDKVLFYNTLAKNKNGEEGVSGGGDTIHTLRPQF